MNQTLEQTVESVKSLALPIVEAIQSSNTPNAAVVITKNGIRVKEEIIVPLEYLDIKEG